MTSFLRSMVSAFFFATANEENEKSGVDERFTSSSSSSCPSIPALSSLLPKVAQRRKAGFKTPENIARGASLYGETVTRWGKRKRRLSSSTAEALEKQCTPVPVSPYKQDDILRRNGKRHRPSSLYDTTKVQARQKIFLSMLDSVPVSSSASSLSSSSRLSLTRPWARQYPLAISSSTSPSLRSTNMDSSSRKKPVVRNKGGVVSHADIASTKTDGWLTDVVIYEFMNEMCEDWQQNGKHGVRVGVMRSHFMTKYMRKGYEGVKGWCKKALGGENIIDRDIVFVPVHCGGNHWCLCVLHRDRYKDGQYQLYFFDSIEASREESKERYAGALLNYVHEEYADRRNSGLSEGELHVEIVTVKVPPQRDNSSCGVFVLYYVEQILKHDSVRKMIVSLDCGDIINVAAQRFRVKEAMIKMHRRNGDCKHGSTCIYRRDVIVIE